MHAEIRESSKKIRRGISAIPGSKNKLVSKVTGSYICDENGETISKVYSEIYTFNKGLAVFEMGAKKGIITESGAELFKGLLDNVCFDGDIIRICKKGKWGLANRDGKIICTPKYSFIEKFKNGYARFCTVEGEWGVLKDNGRIVIPPKYEFLGGLDKAVIVAKNYKGYGGINLKGDEVIPFRYSKIGFEGEATVIYNSSTDKSLI